MQLHDAEVTASVEDPARKSTHPVSPLMHHAGLQQWTIE